MKKILIIASVIILSIVAGVVIAHAAPGAEVQPTYTPNPTYTPWATFTPCITLLPPSTPYPTQTAYPIQDNCWIPPNEPTSTMTPSGNAVTVSNVAELNGLEWLDGMTVYIQEGIYKTTLRPSADNVTIIALGKVELFGGRENLLPYCGEPNYQDTPNLRSHGIEIYYVKNVRLTGPFYIHGYGISGVRFTNAENIVLDSFHITNNGSAGPNNPGIKVWGYAHNISLNNVEVHDNGSDAIQTGGGSVRNWTIINSKLYNSRKHPNGEAFNYCSHSDGMQIYGGGLSEYITFENVELFGFTNSVILGQTADSNGNYAKVDYVTFRNVDIYDADDNGILGYPGIKSENWLIENTRVDATGANGNVLFLEGYGHRIIGSYFVGSNIYLPDGLAEDTNNCRWNTTGYTLGKVCQR